MIKLPLSVVRVAAFCLPLALVASCGSGSEAVQGTKININPPSVAVSSPTKLALTVVYIVQSYQIELRSPSGAAQVNTKVSLVSRGTIYSGLPDIQNANVVCTGNSTPPAGPGDPPLAPAECTDPNFASTRLPNSYVATTDSAGHVQVTMIFAFFSGDDGTVTILEAFSGSSYGKTDVVLTCQDAGASTCP